jgi:hypothetical protein
MLDFQAAERQRLEEPASDVGLESLCALVRCDFFISMYILSLHVSPTLSILLCGPCIIWAD